MQWEYACLIQKEIVIDKSTPKKYTWEWGHTFYFHSPGGTVPLEGASSVEVLNQLGQDGWEALAVEPRYASFHETYGRYGPSHLSNQVDANAEWLVERTIWLKRPINTSTSR